MVSAINAAVSGLNAASKRLEVSANNVANQFSTMSMVNGQLTDQPYVPQQVDQVTLGDGGVEALVTNKTPATISTPDGNNGVVQMPNVDPEQEVVNQNIASYDYQANLKTIRWADEMDKSLLDIIS